MNHRLGDQHKAAAATANPFEEVKTHVNQYTAEEIATLSSRLEKRLGPEYISTRPGASGQRVSYLAADKCINLANEVFGFNGWSSAIQQIQIDFVDENQGTGKVSLGLSVIVRVTLRDGTFHEDIGYGSIENCKGKAMAFEKAKKEGTTDALKRTLRNFGNILGNCLYDKSYLTKVAQLKAAPIKWDPNDLHRHPDYAPEKKDSAREANSKALEAPRIEEEPVKETPEVDFKALNSASTVIPSKALTLAKTFEVSGFEPEDEFATDDFDEVDFGVARDNHTGFAIAEPLEHPARLGNSNANHKETERSPIRRCNQVAQQSRPSPCYSEQSDTTVKSDPSMSRNNDLKSVNLQQNPPHHQPSFDQRRTVVLSSEGKHVPAPPLVVQNHEKKEVLETLKQQDRNSTGPSPSAPSIHPEYDPPMGFFTARAAETILNATGPIATAPSFNPRLESPSIRKTAGVDHTKTKPVGKDILAPPPMPVPPGTVQPNFVNPQADKTRRIGMPTGASSPLSNRSSYRPPQIKRPTESSLVPQSRAALGDATSATINIGPRDGGDCKRQKVHDAAEVKG
ncbi:MAG: hypothetical protein LQ351_004790 [Letrouitia transgressa]|nr:MAG: hypothetical protein LQ351_004790 [Letrouitia transgressa]